MEIERAMEILTPEHRERYDGLEEVNEACRMGVEALRRQMKKAPDEMMTGEVREWYTDRRGRIEGWRGRFTPGQSRRACKQYRKRKKGEE